MGWIMGSVIFVTRMNARIDFIENRLEKVIELCCDEIHKSDKEILNASSQSKRWIPMGIKRQDLSHKSSSSKAGASD